MMDNITLCAAATADFHLKGHDPEAFRRKHVQAGQSAGRLQLMMSNLRQDKECIGIAKYH